MELIFVRHGQPQWSVDGYTQADPHLTELGHRQAEEAAKRLAAARRPVAELIVSPATRSQETAAPLAEATGLPIKTVADLTEIRLPTWDGQLEEHVIRLFQESRNRPPEDWWDGIDGGESFRDFHVRVTAAMAGILEERSIVPDRGGRPHLWHVESDPHRIVIVAHGGTNSVALGWLLGLEPTPWEWERLVLGHASMARVKAVPLAGEHVFSLRTFNDVEHLAVDQRTR